MAVRIGEKCTTASGRSTGTLVSIGREIAQIKQDDGKIATVPTSSIRRVPRTSRKE